MAIGTLLGIASIGLSLFGGKQERDAIDKQTEADEAARRFNAAQTRREAARRRLVGAEDEFSLRMDLRERLARNRVGTAAAGVTPEGTPLETELMLIRDFAGDIATIEEQTRVESQELELLASFQDEFATDVGRAGKVRKRTALTRNIGDTLGLLSEIIV